MDANIEQFLRERFPKALEAVLKHMAELRAPCTPPIAQSATVSHADPVFSHPAALNYAAALTSSQVAITSLSPTLHNPPPASDPHLSSVTQAAATTSSLVPFTRAPLAPCRPPPTSDVHLTTVTQTVTLTSSIVPGAGTPLAPCSSPLSTGDHLTIVTPATPLTSSLVTFTRPPLVRCGPQPSSDAHLTMVTQAASLTSSLVPFTRPPLVPCSPPSSSDAHLTMVTQASSLTSSLVPFTRPPLAPCSPPPASDFHSTTVSHGHAASQVSFHREPLADVQDAAPSAITVNPTNASQTVSPVVFNCMNLVDSQGPSACPVYVMSSVLATTNANETTTELSSPVRDPDSSNIEVASEYSSCRTYNYTVSSPVREKKKTLKRKVTSLPRPILNMKVVKWQAEEIDKSQPSSNSAPEATPLNDEPTTREKTPPPIYLRDKASWVTVWRAMEDQQISYTSARSTVAGVKITVSTPKDYCRLTAFLRSKNHEYNTYILEDKRRLRVVIRGVAKDIDAKNVFCELRAKRIPVWEIHRMHHPITKKPYKLLLVVLKLTPEANAIFSLETVCGFTDIKIETLRKEGIQGRCHLCRVRGPTARYCYVRSRRVKDIEGSPVSMGTAAQNNPAVSIASTLSPSQSVNSKEWADEFAVELTYISEVAKTIDPDEVTALAQELRITPVENWLLLVAKHISLMKAIRTLSNKYNE